MKILMVNNRLKVYGGEGTYMTSIGDELSRQGHEVQYFGLEDPEHVHGNKFNIYAAPSKNPLSLIQNKRNRKLFSQILDKFQPDIVHLNLIYFTLTPSILIETKRRNIPVIQTIHDGKIVCPCYQLYKIGKNEACSECVDGKFSRCFWEKCHKNSRLYSYIAFREAIFNKKNGYYNFIDKFVFPSKFMMKLHNDFGIPKEKSVVLCNFSRVSKIKEPILQKENYVLFFGRITKVKGIECLVKTIKMLPGVQFVIAGEGEMKSAFKDLLNCRVVGFKTGKELEELIVNATCSVFPSIWYENCPMGILESIALGTPVIGANIGGIPELIKDGVTGFIFEPNNENELCDKINTIINSNLKEELSLNCIKEAQLDNVEVYTNKILAIYDGMYEKVK